MGGMTHEWKILKFERFLGRPKCGIFSFLCAFPCIFVFSTIFALCSHFVPLDLLRLDLQQIDSFYGNVFRCDIICSDMFTFNMPGILIFSYFHHSLSSLLNKMLGIISVDFFFVAFYSYWSTSKRMMVIAVNKTISLGWSKNFSMKISWKALISQMKSNWME